jgi:peptidoglycan/xylan/chitin deacetylase (PgdA/CDA1 family)
MKGKLVISLDFEKYWGMRDHKSLKDCQENLEKVDKICSTLLDIFKQYDIHATWATVGFLSFNNKKELLKKLPSDFPNYTDSNLGPYEYIQQNDLESKYHFADATIRKIIETPGQELASHTMSHFYCLEEGQNHNNFEQDLKKNIDVFKINYNRDIESIVFPRNQVNPEYKDILINNGVSIYRGNETNWIYKKKMNYQLRRFLRLIDSFINLTGSNTFSVVKPANGKLLNISSSRFLRPVSLNFSILNKLRLNRIKSQMNYAAKKGQLFHLWWHPHNFGNSIEENSGFLIKILDYFKILEKNYNFKSYNMKEVKENLN